MNRLSSLQIIGNNLGNYTNFILIFLSFIILWFSLYAPIYDGDIWFHLLYGKYMIENLTLIHDHTLFSWTPSSNDTIYCSWIGEIIYYLLFEFFGEPGIIFFRYLVATVSIVIVYCMAWHRRAVFNPLTPLVVSLCILVMSYTILDKPEIMSFLFMTILVFNWYWIKLKNTQVYLNIYLFPTLMLVWVNTHGLSLFGCIFLFCVGMGETLNQIIYKVNALPRKIYYHLMFSLVISAGTLAITPYGYRYVVSTFMGLFDKKLFSDFTFVGAYQKTFSYGILNFSLFADVAIILTAIVMYLALRNRKMDFVPILSNLVFAYLYTVYGRLTFLWLPVFSLSVVFYCPDLTLRKSRKESLIYVMVVLATLCILGFVIYQNYKQPPKEKWFDFSASATFTMEKELDFINENYPKGRLANFYNHGGYILWKSWPERKVMIDQRYFPYRNWFEEYMAFERGDDLDVFLKKYQFDVIAIPHNKLKVINWFNKSDQWRAVFYGKSAIVFVKEQILPGATAKSKINILTDFSDMKSFNTAQILFGTALRLDDVAGADDLIRIMKTQFTRSDNKTYIQGFQLLKEARQSYDTKNYTQAIELYEIALKQKVIYPGLYSGALLMQSINDWHNDKRGLASIKMIQSLLENEAYENTYNLGIMACEIGKMNQPDKIIALRDLSEAEKNVLKKWKEFMQELAEKYSGVAEYSTELKNIRAMLQDDKFCGFDFMEPSWLITNKQGGQ